VAHHRSGREVRPARGGIRDREAFSGHEMRGLAGTGRGGISMAGGRQGPMPREGGRGTTEGPSLAITAMLFSSIDWCCRYYFVRNSLLVLLEALCARILFLRIYSRISRLLSVSGDEGGCWQIFVLYTHIHESWFISFHFILCIFLSMMMIAFVTIKLLLLLKQSSSKQFSTLDWGSMRSNLTF